jgi:hypothetical protein
MKFLEKVFGKPEPPIKGSQDEIEPIVIVPIPPLVTLLIHLQKEKGTSLTEAEVVEVRDKAICMSMRVSHGDQLEAKRGYADISLENAWDDWQAFLAKNPNASS